MMLVRPQGGEGRLASSLGLYMKVYYSFWYCICTICQLLPACLPACLPPLFPITGWPCLLCCRRCCCYSL